MWAATSSAGPSSSVARRTTPSHGPARPRTRPSRRCGSGHGSRHARRRRRAPRRGPPRPRRRDRPGARPTRATGRLSPPARVAVAHDHVPHRPVDRVADGPARAGALPRHAGSAASEPLEIVVGRPPAARHPDQPRARDLADVHACAVRASRRAPRARRARGTRRASSTGRASRPRRAPRAASRQRSATAAAWSNAHAGSRVERREQARERGLPTTSSGRSGRRPGAARSSRRARRRPARSSSAPRPAAGPGRRRRARRSSPGRRATSGPRS